MYKPKKGKFLKRKAGTQRNRCRNQTTADLDVLDIASAATNIEYDIISETSTNSRSMDSKDIPISHIEFTTRKKMDRLYGSVYPMYFNIYNQLRPEHNEGIENKERFLNNLSDKMDNLEINHIPENQSIQEMGKTEILNNLVTEEERVQWGIKYKSKAEEMKKIEEKVLQCVEDASARAGPTRVAALTALRAALQRRHLAGALSAHGATLADALARALRRGKDAERRAAAAVAPLLALQLAEGGEAFARELRPALAAAAADRQSGAEARAESCAALALLCLLLEEDPAELPAAMRELEAAWASKGGEEGALHAAALDGWALLLPLLEPAHALELLRPALRRLLELLEASSLEVRLAAGGALAVAHENVAEDEAVRAQLARAMPLLAELSTDSHKYRAKRDRKLQRATFRDIIKYLQNGEIDCEIVYLDSERYLKLELETWTARCRYAAIVASLGPGLLTLAPHSPSLQSALALPDLPAVSVDPSAIKFNKIYTNKLQQHSQNIQRCRERQECRKIKNLGLYN